MKRRLPDRLRSPAPTARDLASFLRPGSLRFKALTVVILLVIAPLVWVWGSSLWDTGTQLRMARDLTATTATVARTLQSGTLQAEQMARNNRVRIRVIREDGTLLLDADHEGNQRWHDRITDIFFGPEGRPEPATLDRARPPLLERPEISRAQRKNAGHHCELADDLNLLVCAEARLLDTPQGRVWLHVQSSVARTTRALYADRFQMLQLTLYVLMMAIPLTLWLGTRWVRPMESLRDQALERTQGRVSTEPLLVDRNDEYGDLADAFNTLLKALENQNQANETFAADLAHELKNPIAAVQAASEALAPGRPLTEQRAARLHRILTDSSARMAVVIDRFLELARAEAGLSNREWEPFELTALATGLLEAHRADERFTGVTFELDLCGPTWIYGTKERLETAIRNLLSNAASFASPTGTVRLRIKKVDQKITLTVTDTGPGIAPDDLDAVFDRYFSKRQGGTGLGLALSKAIVEAHGGHLSATSILGEGATFILQLPHGLSAPASTETRIPK